MPNTLNSVSFTGSPEYQSEFSALERRRRLAEALQAEGQTPISPNRMAGGYVVPISRMEGLAQLGKALSGGYMARKTDERKRELSQQMSSERSQKLVEALRQGMGKPEIPQPAPELGGGPGRPAVPGNPMEMYRTLAGSQDPMLQQAGLQGAMASMPKPAEPFTLSPGQQRFGLDNQSIAAVPEKPKNPGEFEAALITAGIDPKGPEAQRLSQERLQKMVSHPPQANVKVDVKTGESIGKEIGPMVAESRASALGALQAGETANRIRGALAVGNVTLGPTATVRNMIDQLAQVMGVPGKDTEERLVNTRQVARGLAQFTIAARKSLKGQGQVSDFEGKLLQKAESGEISNFTIPELKSFIDVTERLAKLQYGLHEHNLGVMRKRPDLQNLVPFYEVPKWGAFDAPADTASSAVPAGVDPKEWAVMTPEDRALWK